MQSKFKSVVFIVKAKYLFYFDKNCFLSSLNYMADIVFSTLIYYSLQDIKFHAYFPKSLAIMKRTTFPATSDSIFLEVDLPLLFAPDLSASAKSLATILRAIG